MLVCDVSLEFSQSFLLVCLGLDLIGRPLPHSVIVLLHSVVLPLIDLIADLISILQAVGFHALDLLLKALIILVLSVVILNHLRVILFPGVLAQSCSRHL